MHHFVTVPWHFYIVPYCQTSSPTQSLPITSYRNMHFLRLWNGMVDRHRAEITVIQFTGHSLLVHHFVMAPWHFYLVPYCQPSGILHTHRAFAIETFFKTYESVIVTQKAFTAHFILCKMMMFWVEFSTHSSINFLSETARFRLNIKWPRKTLCSDYRFPSLKKKRFNCKHMVCTGLRPDINWFYLKKNRL